MNKNVYRHKLTVLLQYKGINNVNFHSILTVLLLLLFPMHF